MKCVSLVAALVAASALDAQDTVRVRAAAPPIWGTDVTLTPVFSLGQLNGPDEIAFGSIQKFAADRAGRFYVYDAQDNQIRAYSATGKFLRNIGRKGGGPGEYQWVVGMTMADDSLLVIHDLNAARITFFTPDGKVRRSFVEPRATWGGSGRFTVDRQGLVYVMVPMTLRPRTAATAGAMDEGEAIRSMGILRLRADGSHADSLTLPPPMNTPRGFYLATADGGNNNFQAASHSAALVSGGFVFGNGDRFRLVIRPSNGPVRVVERPSESVAVGGDERANWREYAEYFSHREGGQRQYEIPGTKPVFRDVFTDDDSRIWVSVYAPARKIELPPRPAGKTGPRLYWQQPATYEVFSNLGEYLGQVVLPMRSQMVAARGNRLWVLAKGADDEDMIRLYTMSGVH